MGGWKLRCRETSASSTGSTGTSAAGLPAVSDCRAETARERRGHAPTLKGTTPPGLIGNQGCAISSPRARRRASVTRPSTASQDSGQQGPRCLSAHAGTPAWPPEHTHTHSTHPTHHIDTQHTTHTHDTHTHTPNIPNTHSLTHTRGGHNLTPAEPLPQGWRVRAAGVVAAGTHLKTLGDPGETEDSPALRLAAAWGPRQRCPRSTPRGGGWCRSTPPRLRASTALRGRERQPSVLRDHQALLLNSGLAPLPLHPGASRAGHPTCASAVPQAQLQDPRALGPCQTPPAMPPRAQGPLWKAQVDPPAPAPTRSTAPLSSWHLHTRCSFHPLRW